jgi:hypothetical protein
VQITRSQLRKIIREVAASSANASGVGDNAIRSWLIDELLVDNSELTLSDILQQAEGAGFESEVTEDTIEDMIAAKEIVEKGDKLVIP